VPAPRPLPSGLRVVRRDPLEDGPAGGRPAVLVHGAMDRATSFTRLMAKLADWTIVAYDRRGYGRSSLAGPPEAFDDQVHDLLTVLDDQPAVAFGHSLGGDVVLATADRHPGLITSALVWEPPLPWMPWWPVDSASRGAGSHLGPEDRAEWFMRRMVGDRVWERLPSRTREQRRAEGHTLDADLRALDAGPLFDPSHIRVPVIVGRGGAARVHHRRSARELAALLPMGELAEIADAGHGAHLSHPSEVAELIRRIAGTQPVNIPLFHKKDSKEHSSREQ
jgi:pimeloyl-ACP methyl ester carboxylesterase